MYAIIRWKVTTTVRPRNTSRETRRVVPEADAIHLEAALRQKLGEDEESSFDKADSTSSPRSLASMRRVHLFPCRFNASGLIVSLINWYEPMLRMYRTNLPLIFTKFVVYIKEKQFYLISDSSLTPALNWNPQGRGSMIKSEIFKWRNNNIFLFLVW